MPEPASDIWDFNPPHAVIRQCGRWKYEIYLSHGFMRIGNEFGGPYRYGYNRAKKKADRMLAKYLLREKRSENTTKVYP